MLVIRAEQVRTLERNRRVSFEKELAKHLEAKLRERSVAAAEGLVARVVAQGLEQCTRFGLTTEAHVAQFAEILLLHGNGVGGELPKQALAILLSYGMDPNVKLDRFERWARGVAEKKGPEHAIS